MTKKYYRRNPPSITGPSSICYSYSPATFTVSNASSGYTWDKSSNLTLVSTSGNTATFTANGNGSAWVYIKGYNTDVQSGSVI